MGKPRFREVKWFAKVTRDFSAQALNIYTVFEKLEIDSTCNWRNPHSEIMTRGERWQAAQTSYPVLALLKFDCRVSPDTGRQQSPSVTVWPSFQVYIPIKAQLWSISLQLMTSACGHHWMLPLHSCSALPRIQRFRPAGDPHYSSGSSLQV